MSGSASSSYSSDTGHFTYRTPLRKKATPVGKKVLIADATFSQQIAEKQENCRFRVKLSGFGAPSQVRRLALGNGMERAVLNEPCPHTKEAWNS